MHWRSVTITGTSEGDDAMELCSSRTCCGASPVESRCQPDGFFVRWQPKLLVQRFSGSVLPLYMQYCRLH